MSATTRITLKLVLLAVIAGCGPRHIDYTKGTGPQGGPDKPSNEGGNHHGILATIEPRGELDYDPYFTLTASNGAYSVTSPFRFDYESSELIEGSTRLGGSYECVTPSRESSIRACEEFSVLIPPLWLRRGTPGWPNDHLRARVLKPISCELKGKFPWEAEAHVWAKGKMSQIKRVEAEGSVIINILNRLSLKTVSALIDKTTRIENFRVSFTRSFGDADIDMQFPVRSFDGRRVSLSEKSSSIWFSATGDASEFKGFVEFFEVETRKSLWVDLELKCGMNHSQAVTTR